MNKCGLSIRAVLERLTVYDTENAALSAEISAYEKGLGFVLDAIDEVLGEAFVQTASHDGLNKRELLFRPVNTRISDDDKRALLIERNTLRGCFVEDTEKRLGGTGIIGNIVENHLDGAAINVLGLAGISKEEAVREAAELMPAHLPLYLDMTGETWEAVDLKDRTFDQADSSGGCWDQAEISFREELINYGINR